MTAHWHPFCPVTTHWQPFCPVTAHWQTHWQATHTPTSPFCHTLRYPALFSIFHTLLAVSIFYAIYTPLYPPRSPFFGPGDAYRPSTYYKETLFLLPPFLPFLPWGGHLFRHFYYTEAIRSLYGGYIGDIGDIGDIGRVPGIAPRHIKSLTPI